MKTNNKGYGFHGEIANSEMMKREIARLYALAAKTLIEAGIAASEIDAIDFLDSRMGRHLGDECYDCASDEAFIATIRSKAPAHYKHYLAQSGTSRANSK